MTLKMGKKVEPKSITRGGHYGQHHQRRQLLPLHLVHHCKRPSTLKTKYFSVISSIKKSIQKCHRRLVEFFSKQEGARRRGQGFVILQREEAGSGRFETRHRPRLQLEFEADSDLTNVLVSRKSNRNRLPPLVSDNMKTIVLDLDETLVHSVPGPPPKMYDFMFKPNIFGLEMNFYVLKRPGVDEFLEAISKKYEVVVFTAGLEPYASLLLDVLDPKGLISHRLYRDSCKQIGRGRFIKDLSTMGRDLGKVVIVDDNPKSYSLQPANGIPIKRFEYDIEDTELKKLTQFFQRYCDDFKDMRDAVKQYYGGDKTTQPRSSSKTTQ
ncbi:putative Haloacid dehalogenase-like hydrolase superfamily protein [Hibiscus syriacus]|uniref:Haloacid dehalogenase-like hydrolase superfamily protein n=1 Tax=Hibiscus syriacus TaxID=106335 RepID=A0A6A3CJS6_HIBSY|nr:CTD small phosphatase-like protein 1 [Hibiscus syriacus]KAE8728744.1 putative Haloacid dehalogenase-like hydrolase superfamily protein [Hibiscus syriacus]